MSSMLPVSSECAAVRFLLRTDFEATYPPGAMPIPDESSNRSLSPLLTTAGVGEGAKVAGTEDGM